MSSAGDSLDAMYSVYLPYWYKSTNTDAARACSAGDFLDPMGGFLNSNSQSSAAGCDSSSDAWNVGAGMTYADVC